MASNLIFAILAIPLLLVIAIAVISGFSSGSQFVFEGTAISNENMGNLTGTTTTLYPVYQIKDDSTATCKVKNMTTAVTLTTMTNPNATCVVSPLAGYSGYVTAVTNVSDTGSQVFLNYTPYSKDGYANFQKVYTSTTSGFNLAALLPFILIAMVVVGLIISALAM